MKRVAAWIFIVCFIILSLWILYGELQLLVKHDYTIATIQDIYRGGKMEKNIQFTYTVEGVNYERGATWDRKARVGERYVVKYAVYAPYGSKFLFDHHVPDSMQQTNGKAWKQYLRKQQLY